MSQKSFDPSPGGRTTPKTRSGKRVAYGFALRFRVIQMSGKGLSSNEISNKTGVDASVIRRWLRRYRAYGRVALQPYWHPEHQTDSRSVDHAEKDKSFQEAYEAYATSREPVASITRRFGLDYHSFKYHVERYHPELVERRERVKQSDDNK